ncbi:MAG: helix-turn-helix transcriptional regulator, partial [Candidatus Limnocylindrales bacterium]
QTVCTRMVGDLLEAAAASGDTSRLRGVIAELEAKDRTVPRPWIGTNLARGRALLAAADGDLEAAVGWATAAIVHAEQLRMPFELGRVHLLAGRMDRRRKARRSAASHLERARAIFAGLGAARWVAIADAELSRTGRRTVRSDSLSETEDAVARLAARGLTNRQVGEAAFLTAKSVEGVLGRVYAKLGIRSRAELGAWLRDQPGDGPSSDRESPV